LRKFSQLAIIKGANKDENQRNMYVFNTHTKTIARMGIQKIKHPPNTRVLYPIRNEGSKYLTIRDKKANESSSSAHAHYVALYQYF